MGIFALIWICKDKIGFAANTWHEQIEKIWLV
jgi:hypothetical protein